MQGGQVDEEGAELGFEALVVQLFEFLLTLAGSSRFRPLITPCLDQMVYLVLGELQDHHSLNLTQLKLCRML